MKKKIVLFLFFITLLIFCCYYTYCLHPAVDDEYYNFGFAKNIAEGNVPYLDFNLIIPPLFPYLLSIIIKLFGNHLLLYHVVIAVIITTITYLAYQRIGYPAITLYLLLLIYPYIGYNLFCLLLMILIFYTNYKNKIHQDLVEAILISLMFLTKQTMGILMIPNLLFSKKKKKTIAIYLITFCILSIYLLVYKNFYQFIDYTFLGMIDFTTKNNKTDFTMLAEIIVVLILIILIIKEKKINIKKMYIYTLMFQIIAFPNMDYAHFFVSIVPFIYLLLIKIKSKLIPNVIIVSFAFSICMCLSIYNLMNNNNYQFLSNYPDGFMKGRLTFNLTSDYINRINQYLEKYPNHDIYILGNFAYQIKLALNKPITKYDIINNGNMGYHGEKKYIEEITNNCKKNKCLFIMNDSEVLGKINNQSNLDILQYVDKHYYKTYISGSFSVYTNKNLVP